MNILVGNGMPLPEEQEQSHELLMLERLLQRKGRALRCKWGRSRGQRMGCKTIEGGRAKG